MSIVIIYNSYTVQNNILIKIALTELCRIYPYKRAIRSTDCVTKQIFALLFGTHFLFCCRNFALNVSQDVAHGSIIKILLSDICNFYYLQSFGSTLRNLIFQKNLQRSPNHLNSLCNDLFLSRCYLKTVFATM